MQLSPHLTAFLIHVGTRQLLPTYIEKKHYCHGKKVADVGFLWHLDTLFQPSDISLVENTEANSFPRP